MSATVFSRSSASQLAGGEPEVHSDEGKKLDGLPLTEKLPAFTSARLAKPV